MSITITNIMHVIVMELIKSNGKANFKKNCSLVGSHHNKGIVSGLSPPATSFPVPFLLIGEWGQHKVFFFFSNANANC